MDDAPPSAAVKKFRRARFWAAFVVVASLVSAATSLASSYKSQWTWWTIGFSLLVAALSGFNVVLYQRMLTAASRPQ